VRDAAITSAEWKLKRADWAWTPKIEALSTLAPVPANTDPNSIGGNIEELTSLNIGPFFRQTVRIWAPVYTFGRITQAQELAQINVESAKLERERAFVELHFQVRRAYYGLQLASAFDEMLRDGQKLIKEQLADMEEAREFGDRDVSIRDLRRLQIFDAEIDSRALDNKKLITLASAGVEFLSGAPLTPEQVHPFDEKTQLPPLGTLDEHLALAMKHRPELKLLKQGVAAREVQKQLKLDEFFPVVFLAGDLTYGRSTETIAPQRICRIPSPGADCLIVDDLVAQPFANPYRQFTVGIFIGLRWNLDIMDQYAQYQDADASLVQTQAQERLANNAVILDIKRLHVEAAQALEKVSIQRRRLEAARRWRDQFGLSAQQAGARRDDAVEPLRAYYETRVLYLQSVYDYLIARADLAQGIGLRSLD
jgi:outer membrane protein TolC